MAKNLAEIIEEEEPIVVGMRESLNREEIDFKERGEDLERLSELNKEKQNWLKEEKRRVEQWSVISKTR